MLTQLVELTLSLSSHLFNFLFTEEIPGAKFSLIVEEISSSVMINIQRMSEQESERTSSKCVFKLNLTEGEYLVDDACHQICPSNELTKNILRDDNSLLCRR